MVELLPSGQGVNCSAMFPFAVLVHVFTVRLVGGIIQLREDRSEEAGRCSHPCSPSGRVSSI